MPNKGNILAVDDTEASLKVLSDILREEGYSVRSAMSGELALRSALFQPPDLVLLDVRMPDMDGFEVCRQLKSQASTRDVPVIFISAVAETDEKVHGFTLGAVDYVTKPYQREELLARVATHVNLRLIQRQVKAQNEELRQYREQLEELVARRTEELEASNQRLSLMSFALDQVREAAYLIEDSGRFVYVNHEACRAHGYTAEELCQMTVTDIDPDFTQDAFRRSWETVLAQGVATFETRHRRRDGSYFSVEIAVSSINFGDRALNLALARDITERKEAERRLRESYGLLQELTTRRESAREEERKHIAREIHDELGQQLTALRMGIATLRLQFGADQPLLADRVKDLIDLSDKTIQLVRNVATTLRPAVIDSGISPALEWLATRFEQQTGVACDVDVPDDYRVTDERHAMALFRIVQEALTNVARHAKADLASVKLSMENDVYILQIRDDGCGFAASPGNSHTTFGLLGMRERALMLGGELEIESEPGQGTVVTAKIPAHSRRDA